MISLVHRAGTGVCILVALLISAAAAVAAPEPPAAADNDKKPPPNKRVCRTVQVTGSLMRQRVCLKQKQWDQMREEAQRAAQDADAPATKGEGGS